MTKNKTERTIEQDANKSIINAQQVLPTKNQDLSLIGRAKSFLTQDPYGKALTTAGFTSWGMATLMYFPELFQAQKQIGIKSSPFTLNYKALQWVLLGYGAALKGSSLKNAAITQRDPIKRQVDSFFDETSKEKNGNANKVNQYLSTGVSALGVTGIDMVFTHYMANVRIFYSANQEISQRLPAAMSWREKFRFAQSGVALRGSRNYFGALGCIGTSEIVGPIINPYISSKEHPFVHHATTSVISGIAISPFSNMADALWRRQMLDYNFSTFTAPRVRDVVKNTLQKEGLAALLRGTGWGAFNYMIAFAGVNMFAEILNRYVFEPEQPKQPQVSQSRNRNAFFPASNASSSSATPKIEEVKEVEQPQATGPR
ncbi:hypothetical protein [Legionella gresilensis]|uniref:hypothetical protein n=1 Tax=Legionella gresilensis TaxID=91823 RepID=UPI00104115C7|nr:hypothetical protein [Legionella gresilensis]